MKVVKVDLEHHCIWDDLKGVVLSVEGTKKLLEIVSQAALMSWIFSDVYSSEHDDTLFILHFEKEKV